MPRLATLVVFAAAFCVETASADDVPTTITAIDENSPLAREVPLTMRAFVDARIVPGVTVLVTDRNETHLKAAIGWRSSEFDQPVSDDDIYWLASVTKPMAATAFMMLVDEGLVDLDDPVSRFVPEMGDVKLRDGRPAVITVKHCLTHTSGLSNDRDVKQSTLAESITHMASRPLDFEPGSEWRYSRSLDVIARISEVVSGLEYSEFMKQRLFEPLGMTNTQFNLSPDQVDRAVLPTSLNKETGGLDAAETDYISFDPAVPNWPSPSYAAFSTADDLAKFARFLLNRGKVGDMSLMSERAVDAMTSLQTGALKTGWTPGNGWGLGWCVVRYPQHVTRSLSPGSFGHGGVYGPQLWIDPDLGVAYVVLFERKDIGNSDGSDLREAFQVSAARALRRSPQAEPSGE